MLKALTDRLKGAGQAAAFFGMFSCTLGLLMLVALVAASHALQELCHTKASAGACLQRARHDEQTDAAAFAIMLRKVAKLVACAITQLDL